MTYITYAFKDDGSILYKVVASNESISDVIEREVRIAKAHSKVQWLAFHDRNTGEKLYTWSMVLMRDDPFNCLD